MFSMKGRWSASFPVGRVRFNAAGIKRSRLVGSNVSWLTVSPFAVSARCGRFVVDTVRSPLPWLRVGLVYFCLINVWIVRLCRPVFWGVGLVSAADRDYLASQRPWFSSFPPRANGRVVDGCV